MECQEGSVGFEELEKHALQAGEPPLVSGKQVPISFLCTMYQKKQMIVLYDTTRDLYWYHFTIACHICILSLELPNGTV